MRRPKWIVRGYQVGPFHQTVLGEFRWLIGALWCATFQSAPWPHAVIERAKVRP